MGKALLSAKLTLVGSTFGHPWSIQMDQTHEPPEGKRQKTNPGRIILKIITVVQTYINASKYLPCYCSPRLKSNPSILVYTINPVG